MSAELLINIAYVTISVIAIICTGIWQLTRVESRLAKAIADHEIESQAAISTDRRITSDAISAVRQKLSDVELEGYKIFVRRDSFHEIMNRVSSENAAFKEALEARLDRQEVKIDKLIERTALNAT